MTSSENAFPWPQVMRFGLGQLHLSTSEFWALSLPELNAALRHHYPLAGRALSRNDFAALMQQHPDSAEATCDDRL